MSLIKRGSELERKVLVINDVDVWNWSFGERGVWVVLKFIL